MIDQVENEMGPTKVIGYYVYELGGLYDDGQDSPVGFRENLIEAEALRHFVAENRSHRIKWGALDIWAWDIMPVIVPVAGEELCQR